MKIKSILGILCLSLCLLIAPATAAGGDGTSANPYQIETAAELQSIQNDLSASYILMNDIDMSGVSNWQPIGSGSSPFFGTLDGNGKTISNLTLSTSRQNAGFFGTLTSGAVVKDVTFADCSVTSTLSPCGVVIGSIVMSDAEHDTAILDNVDCVRCTVQSGEYNVGCLVGSIYSAEIEITDSTVKYSHAQAISANAGCLVGYVYNSELVMTNCVSENSIAESTGSNTVGCLVGNVRAQSAFIADGCIARNCIAESIDSNVGGILGRVLDAGSTASIKNCVVDCCTIVTLSNYAGGVIGRVQTETTGIVTGCDVTNCTILASSYAAGICPLYS